MTADFIIILGAIAVYAYMFVSKFGDLDAVGKRIMVVLGFVLALVVLITISDDVVINIQNLIDAVNS